ncbi:MAG: hypothetical protein DRQ78_10595 [Epsilonproteobacteria bacterium]|nr:MAG: hypothetical protein DRQ78_10595 [Campylobacterota bacterium]
MATRIERMEESLENYEKKIIEIKEKIEKEKEALIAKRGEAEAKLAEAKAKFDALYGNLPELPMSSEDENKEGGLFDDVPAESVN